MSPQLLLKPVSALGTKVIAIVENFGNAASYIGTAIRELVRPPYRLRLIVQHMEFVGNQSLIIIALSAFFVGAVFSLQIGIVFRVFAAEGMMGAASAKALARELAPMLTGFLIAGRAGAAMTAEIATMKVNEQIDAMEAMGVEPINYIVVPRMIAMMIMTPILSGIFVFIGVFGAYVVGVTLFQVDVAAFFGKIVEIVNSGDIWSGLQKAFIYGIIIALIACRFGLAASGGAKGVGRATTNSVVITLLVLLAFGFVITYFQVVLMGDATGDIF